MVPVGGRYLVELCGFNCCVAATTGHTRAQVRGATAVGAERGPAEQRPANAMNAERGERPPPTPAQEKP